MKNLQTIGASLLLIMALSSTAFADCPDGGIMGTGGICINGIMGTGEPAGEPKAKTPPPAKAVATSTGTDVLLLTMELAIWQNIIG